MAINPPAIVAAPRAAAPTANMGRRLLEPGRRAKGFLTCIGFGLLVDEQFLGVVRQERARGTDRRYGAPSEELGRPLRPLG